ncbi:type I restriction endonuclease subunit R [Sulfitobacter mediterraneus]|uniref:Type I restriction enzyme R subunit n=1 Tax=Sulfitobacter mediterraneus TaxID=83219 RepID=A0A2T6CHC8_9RHOB|nr:DEAD/DEAH box helicase family protein [Sulfitobacter mediterraneus]KIN76923.1 Type I/III endonuclease restriction R subunit [Sulfitobacter mediterraneus KCTC 32188]PTX74907.1 type I restriction enzyme R subunit [Sulfitobacter mediterraneus]
MNYTVSNTKEIALEQAIERHLTGTTTEDLKDGGVESGPYHIGRSTDFDAALALDTALFWEFLEATQGKALEKLKTRNPADWQAKILGQFDKLVKRKGVLHLLKKGLPVDDAHLTLMYPAPLASSAQKVHDNFAANIWSITRQVHHSLANPNESVDMVLFLNGLPIVTLELKVTSTSAPQTARYHGQKQYRERDATQPLMQFGRALVHMTADTDEVWMATKLSGASTWFLPFNKGYNEGAGNPPNPNGHKTAYLWEEVFQPASLAGIIQHFVLLEGGKTDPLAKKTLIFPRYQQLDVVRKLLDHTATHGVGQSYLIQHSAGSGKSNSITWAAYQLIESYPTSADLPGARALDTSLFDSVIVVTDRRLLDKQLRDNISDFSEVKNIVAPAVRSADLKAALENGKKIIITTIQKFPFIIDGIADMSDKRFAVIIDEAHSGQSGLAHDKMNQAMGGGEDPDADDPQDKILAAMQARKMRGNASYFAFTATPKNTTLEKFGTKQPDGSFKPFHLYSMKQAIEEGFILDVLANYTTYKGYYEIQKSIEDNPLFDTAKAQKKLRAYVESSQQTINTKAEIMVEDFMDNVVNAKKLRGKAKGMIVTQNIEMAIRYYRAVQAELAKRGNPFKALIAFSGEKEVDGIKYTEADMNSFPEDKTRKEFDKDEFRLLVVANKYLTGFDQPKLCAMYVDKKLQSVLAVQALSRLNRSAPKLGKRTEDLFVLDFFNSTDDIKAAFDPFFTVTTLSEATDVNVLHELKATLDEAGAYEWSEVEEFCTRFFDEEDAQTLSPLIDAAAERFNVELDLEEKDKIDYKIKAKQFVKVYGQMASIMPFEVLAWEKLFWFLKFLIPKLKIQDPNQDALDELLEAVDLSSYGLERTKLNHVIGLDASESELEPQNPNPRGYREGEVQEDPLEEIIRSFNERWFQGWSATPEEQRVKFLNIVDSVQAHPDYDEKFSDNPDPFSRDLAFEKIMKDVMLRRRKEELELYKLHSQDPSFKASLYQSIKEMLRNSTQRD